MPIPACLVIFRYVPFAALRNVVVALIIAISPAAAETVTIAVLGDSLTAGYGLPPEQGLVPQLELWLQDAGEDVTVLNAGVSGDTTAGGLARLDWTLAPEVDGLIVTLGGNDMLRGLPPEEARRNLDAILTRAEAKGVPVLLIGMKAPGNYGADYKAQFDAIYPELAAAHGTLFIDNLFAPLLDGTTDPAVLAPFFQTDGLHPNAVGVLRIVAGIGPKVRELIAASRK